MTCIAAVVQDGVVYMGSDSIGVSETQSVERKDRKVFQVGQALFGAAGSFRVMQVLQYGLKMPRHPAGVDAHAYMVTKVVPAIKRCLEDGEAIADAEDFSVLVGYRGRLFQIEDDFQVGENAHGYDACGSGCEYALGVLHALGVVFAKTEIPPEMHVEAALAAAAAHCPTVRAPFTIETLATKTRTRKR